MSSDNSKLLNTFPNEISKSFRNISIKLKKIEFSKKAILNSIDRDNTKSLDINP